MKGIAYIYIVAVIGVLLILFSPEIAFLWNYTPSAMVNIAPDKMSGYFEREIVVEATALSNLTVNVTVPYKSTPYQDVSMSVIQGPPYEINSGYNRTWITFHLHNSAEILINYTFVTRPVIYSVSQWNSLGEDAIPASLKNQYDHPEYLNGREVISPELFKNVSLEIIGHANATNVFEEEKAIYDYIVKNFRYDVSFSTLQNPQTALETWELKKGDCAELSFLYVSMLRAIGIPAWVEFGWLFTSTTWAEHAWVGTVIPTSNGLIYGTIDLTKEVGGTDLGLGFFMRGTDRITEWVDDGNSSHLTNYYTFLYGTSYGQVNVQDTVISTNVVFGNFTIVFDPAYAIDPLFLHVAFIGISAIIVYAIIRRPKNL